MAKTSQEYWQKRFEAVEEMNHKTAKDAVNAVTPAFDSAQREIEKEITSWYQRFADNNEISLQEAKVMLNAKELKELKWDIDEYIKYGKKNALDSKWMKELENASAKYHITRLEALKIRTQQAAEKAFGNELDVLDELVARIYTEDYYHTAYEIQKGLGIGWDIGQIDDRKLQNLLKKPWTADGKTFSNRIWTSKSQLLDSLHTELTQMCILGKAPDTAIKNIAARMNVSKNQAGRLIMTESAYFSSVAQKDCFNELNVEKFEIVATLDSHTSTICQQMDGQVFDMKDFEAGVTAPPFHVWCRTTTVPYFEDNDGTRAARDAVTGQTYQVPASMKYPDWKNTFVQGGSKGDLVPVLSIDDLKNQIADKQTEFDDLKNQIDLKKAEFDEFETGKNNPLWKDLHSMSDEDYTKYVDDLKKQEADLTAEYKKIEADYEHYFDRPDRGTPEREEWNKWHEEIKEKYNVDNGSNLFDSLYNVQVKRSAVRDKINDTLKYSNWKSKFAGKTTKDFTDELDSLTSTQNLIQAEIDELNKQLDDAIKLQVEASYNARQISEIKAEIIKKHDNILQNDMQKKELSDILNGMNKEQLNMYDKMSVHFENNDYYLKGTGWYQPAYKKIEMDMNDHSWDDKVGRKLTGAWKTKFHEEMHQLDHILGLRKSKFALLEGSTDRYMRNFTNTATVTGKKMITAIDEDVLNLINTAIDWDVATNGVLVKHVKTLDRISSDGKDALIRYLKDKYPTAKDRALIDTVTDAIGLTTKSNLHPYSYGFWGHDASYSRDRGKDGATSEIWANLAGFLQRNDTEALDAVRELMPNTVNTYTDVYNEVLEYAKIEDLTYTP